MKKKLLLRPITMGCLFMMFLSCTKETFTGDQDLTSDKWRSEFGSANLELAFPNQRGEVKKAYLKGELITYEVISGKNIFQGDIILPDEWLSTNKRERVTEGAGRSDPSSRWPGVRILYRVLYQIDPNLPNQQRVHDAMDYWEEKSNLYFSKLNLLPGESGPPVSDHIYFTTGAGCSSYIGRVGGRQEITLSNSCSTGNAIHEIGHAIGLWHEHTRQDRDQTIAINWNNIIANYEYNFFKYTEIGDGFDHGNLDLQSIMMYGSYAFSRNGLPTITRLDGSTFSSQRVDLSAGDIAIVTTMYPDD